MDYRNPNKPSSTNVAVLVIALILCLCAFMNNRYGGPDMSWLLASTSPTPSPDVTATDPTLEPATVERVVDGDTLVVRRSDGSSAKVRLIGIDAPESVAEDASHNTEEGRLASAYTSSLVDAGSSVWLQRDTSDTDEYGRLLRYMWLTRPNDPRAADEVRTEMLDGVLVDRGYARSKRYEPDTAYNDLFDTFMADAVASDRGVSHLWR